MPKRTAEANRHQPLPLRKGEVVNNTELRDNETKPPLAPPFEKGGLGGIAVVNFLPQMM
jgi:hypothetical protein